MKPHPSAKLNSDLAALLVCGVFFVFWLNLLAQKFRYFGYYDWDLAMYAQAVWALTQGSFHSSLFATNFLTNHAEYIAFFLAPVYKLFPGAFTLVVLKVLAYSCGAYVFYLISKRVLAWPLAFILMILYLIHPANAFMLIYEFHFENLAIPFIFLMYYFFREQKLLPFLTSAFFATIVKENISLVVMMFGFYALFIKRPQKTLWVAGPLILGGGFFALTMFLVTPYLRAAEGITNANQYISMYWNQPSKTAPFAQLLWQNLSSLSATFLSPLNRQYMADLFLPFQIIPVFSPLTILLGTPIFLQHFLAPSHSMHTLFYHYAATAIIFIFLATAESLAKIKDHLRPIFYFFVIIGMVVGYSAYIQRFMPLFHRRVAAWQDRLDPARQKMLEQIPQNSSVVASFDFLAPLADRQEVFSLHNVWQNYATFTGKTPFALPQDLSYALIDWNCPWLWGDLLKAPRELSRQYLNRINAMYHGRRWQVVEMIEGLTLLSAAPGPGQQPPLVENSSVPFADVPGSLNIKMGESVSLVSLKVREDAPFSPDILPLEFVWRSLKKTEDYLAVMIYIMKDDTLVAQRAHPLGYAFNATPLWQKGHYLKERYNILLPGLAAGEYHIQISLFNLSRNSAVEKVYPNGTGLDRLTVLKFTRQQGRKE